MNISEKTKSNIKLTFKIIIPVILLAVVITNYDTLKNLDVRELVSGTSNIAIAFAIVIGIYCAKSVLFVIPAMLIYTSVGMVFETWQAIIINIIGIFAEVLLTYLLGMFLGGDYVKKLLSKNKGGQKILETNIENKFFPLLVIRALPVFPIDFMSLFLGSMKSNIFTYLIVSVVGIAPRVILFTILGEGIYDYIPTELIVKIVICIIPIVAIALIIKHFLSKNKLNKGEKS